MKRYLQAFIITTSIFAAPLLLYRLFEIDSIVKKEKLKVVKIKRVTEQKESKTPLDKKIKKELKEEQQSTAVIEKKSIKNISKKEIAKKVIDKQKNRTKKRLTKNTKPKRKKFTTKKSLKRVITKKRKKFTSKKTVKRWVKKRVKKTKTAINKTKTTNKSYNYKKLTINIVSKDIFLSKVRAKIKSHLIYPLSAKLNHIEGSAIVVFDIDKNGYLVNIKVKKAKRVFRRAIKKAFKNASPVNIPSNLKSNAPFRDIYLPLHFKIY